MPFFDQAQFDVRCEWGENGIERLARSDVVIIVDVLSFSTAVDVATARGATIFPYRFKDESAFAYASKHHADLAVARSQNNKTWSLSPSSLVNAPSGLRLVLPSPNGSTLSFAASSFCRIVLTGCLRNASAVATFASCLGKSIAVIPAGERWPDGTLRPAIEDLIGAGAILKALPGSPSPEAQSAISAFNEFAPDLHERLLACASGRELEERGFEIDVALATQLNISQTVPRLRDNAFIAADARNLDAPPAIG